MIDLGESVFDTVLAATPGMLAIPSSRAAAFESTMSCVSVSFAIFGSLSLRQHPLPPARPRHSQIASGVRERAAFSGSGNTHRNAPFRHEVQSRHASRVLDMCLEAQTLQAGEMARVWRYSEPYDLQSGYPR